MIYLTGDTHRDFSGVKEFCGKMGTTKDDILIILGDVGINYFGLRTMSNPRYLSDYELKQAVSELPVTLFCIHGNHEMRPESIGTYETSVWNGGVVYMEPEFPDLLFAKDGEIFEFEGKRCIVIGGAYSVDKDYRIINGLGWWPDEQPSDDIKRKVENRLDLENWQIDIVLSHTCPYNYISYVVPFIYPDIDNSTEKWLETIEQRLTYSRWYCGHMHAEKKVDKIQFMHNDYTMFNAY